MTQRSETKKTGRFQDRVALVTGATRQPSIGHATAQVLIAEGARVVINGRDPQAVEAALQSFDGAHYSVRGVVGSAEDAATADEIARTAAETFGRIDYVVHTVGGNRFLGSPREMKREALMETIELNTWGAVALVQAALANGLGKNADGASIVTISSGTVHKTTPKMIAYAAGKSALNAITKTLARDLGESGIRVNAVAPGFTKTSGTEDLWGPDDGKSAGESLLLGRMTEARDIANAVAFLLSSEARQITGQILDVDGGNHLMGGGYTPMTDPRLPKREG